MRIRIDGHTDDLGDDDANQRLSEQRAQAVATFLDKAGVARWRMTAVGFGETRPKAKKGEPGWRAQNRRVEILVVGR